MKQCWVFVFYWKGGEEILLGYLKLIWDKAMISETPNFLYYSRNNSYQTKNGPSNVQDCNNLVLICKQGFHAYWQLQPVESLGFVVKIALEPFS